MKVSTELAPSLESPWPLDAGPARSIALLLHGGQVNSWEAARRKRLSYRTMMRFARVLHRVGGGGGLSVRILRYRYRGWNEPGRPAVEDARWALGQLREAHPQAPVVLLGHSMGGRVALRVADHPAVTVVAALAPWTPQGEPVRQLAGRSVLIAHGNSDRTIDPRLSYRFAVRAKEITDRVCRFDVAGDGHAMFRRRRDWSALVSRFIAGELGLHEPDSLIERAMSAAAPEGLAVPLPEKDSWPLTP
jgi:pimeloyl-ACP methyl ester carboxylesterase